MSFSITGVAANERGRVKLRLKLERVDPKEREAARRRALALFHPRYAGQAKRA